ncbi:ferritin-like domain-containing protein [Mycolicibacterium thermoresistibile]
MTTPDPDTPGTDPDRPQDAAAGALFDAVATEHGIIYGYGVVSARSVPEINYLVAEAMAEHRERREDAISMLEARSAAVPLPAPGYQLPITVDTPDAALELAVSMESDAAAAWRAVLEQATDVADRVFAVESLTESAVLAARWRQALDQWPPTTAFPGGNE